MLYNVTKEFRFDAAHRLRNHKGKCKNIHGHGVSLKITLFSQVLNSEEMVIDFGDIKDIMNPIIEQIDHSIIISDEDTELLTLLESFPTKKYIIAGEPTAETLSEMFVYKLEEALKEHIDNGNIFGVSVEFFETPDNSATVTRMFNNK